MRVALLVASWALLTACSDASAPPTATTTASTTPSTSATPAGSPAPTDTTSPFPVERFVPKVTGQLLEQASAHLERRGFQVRVNTVELSSCVPDGLVLRQDPPPRYIRELGSRVTLGINTDVGGTCGLDLPAAEPGLDAAGRAFVAFARGGAADEGLLRTPVRLYLGGRLMHTIPSWRAVHRNSYGSLCPAAGYYASRTCAFSAARTIERYPGPMAVTSAAPDQPCSTGGTLAAKRTTTVTLTPDESRSCVDYFAVELEVAGDGRLVAVNLILSDP